MIYVTHDQHEAMALGERIVVLRQGALQQTADPLTLYRSPTNAFVAGFIGSPPMNLFRGHVAPRGDEFVFTEHNVTGAAEGTRLETVLDQKRGSRLAAFADGNILLGIRAEHIVLSDNRNRHVNALIELVEFLGAETLLHCSTGATPFRVRVTADNSYQVGGRVPLLFNLANALFFNPISEKVIV
ncbi:MAG TPA: TOBE domain-containing protein [Candidatus Acidoferrum sp.]|nr:TOBE domain-containing protein [Candidatus Acidoferrum sp.]